MGFISGSGIAFAGPIRASAISLCALPLLGAAPLASLDVAVDGYRSAKGEVQVCLTTRPDHFPDCQDDPAARRLTVATRDARVLNFGALPSGDYALALIHDENANDRLDTFAGVPREGVGFSRNPSIMFGAPRFKAARFALTSGDAAQRVRVKYFL